jgi:hypothetical protein
MERLEKRQTAIFLGRSPDDVFSPQAPPEAAPGVALSTLLARRVVLTDSASNSIDTQQHIG